MTQEQFNEILERHQHWLDRDCEGWELMRADLEGAVLCGLNLGRADLREANLHGANLCGVNLSEAFLSFADLSFANLRGALLSRADLGEVDLRGAYLHDADLGFAYLHGANLRGAILHGTDLRGAILFGTNLSYAAIRNASFVEADLRGANFYMAGLTGNDFTGAKNLPPMACPDTGSFIGWKRVSLSKYGHGSHSFSGIAKLLIPEDAKRSSSVGRKCRCDKAVVLEIQYLDGTVLDEEAVSQYCPEFVYRAGETVSVPDFCDDRWEECAPGIHFFLTRQEAVDYSLH